MPEVSTVSPSFTILEVGFNAIPAIISYIPAIKGLQALRGVGRLGTALANRNLPAGIALTDITREIDDGKFHDIAMAGAYG